LPDGERPQPLQASAALAHALRRRLGPPAGIASWALALSDLGAGRPEEAAARLAALATAGPGEGHPMITVFAAADLCEAACRTGQDDRARAALDVLEGWAGGTGSAWARALAARCHALLATGDSSAADSSSTGSSSTDSSSTDKADGYFAEALALHAGGGRPFDAARTEPLYGQTLRRHRRRADARSHLRTAYETFDRSVPTPGPSSPGPSCAPPARPRGHGTPARSPGSPRRSSRSPVSSAAAPRTARSPRCCS
jgi:hypothetical protein